MDDNFLLGIFKELSETAAKHTTVSLNLSYIEQN